MKICINGEMFDPDVACIDPSDRGFTLGDGIYETIAIRKGAPRRLANHMARLRSGAETLAISIQNTDAQLEDMVAATIKACDVVNGSARLTLTRGPSARGIVPPTDPATTLVITATPISAQGDDVRAIVSKTTRRNEHSPLSAIKSINVLDSIIARMEAQAAGADDALLLNTLGNVAESTGANVFLLVDGGLITPPIEDGALPGIMRGEVIRLARAEEKTVTLDILMRANEAFLSNALGLRPIVSIDDHAVGDGDAGLITQMLAARL
jgi:branched-chain amino acid aminotransferase